ncbi:MAG: hypothetical protein JST86_13990 [Bacteroidetes bacterium]|nr:hypothetical protein [Bacteroidota bacterium]
MNPVKIKYRICCAFLLVLAMACNNNASTTPHADSTGKTTDTLNSNKELVKVYNTPKDFLDTISKFPFVSASNHYIDSFTNHKQGISFIVDTTAKEFVVTAGYNGEQRFETYYTFSVNRQTRTITVMDPVSGNSMTPEAFEKSQQK